MNKQSTRAILVSLIMILSSLAGCIGDEDLETVQEVTDLINDGNNTTIIGNLGTVMVSTYHIGELVKGIAGEHVEMEYMSLDNIPVHDYEPSASDLIRLQNADVFFYHGLGLEPWVDETLDSLGSDAPTSIQVHTMPTGEETLDYESMLISDLCKTLTAGPFETVELVDHEEHADDVEIHAEFVAHNIEFPHDEHADEDGDDHDDHADEEEDHADEEDDHADEEGDHDEHSEEGHDEHDDHDDGHEGHDHLEAEETITNPAGCPADTMISIFHLEEGEYVIEFDADHPEDFTMAVLKMLGGHAHHDHGDHGDHGDEHGDEHGEEGHGVCHDMDDHTNNDIDNEADCEAAGFMWMEEDDHDEHEGDYCHDTSSHANTNHTTEEECEAAGHMWMEEDGHDDHGDHEDEMTAEQAMAMIDTNNDSSASWDEIWTFWTTDEDGHDEDGHDEDGHDEDGHDEDGHDDENEFMMVMLMGMFNESDMDDDELLNMSEFEHFMEDMDSMEENMDGASVFLMMYDADNDGYLSWDEYMSMWSNDGDDHDEDGHDEHEEEYQLAILFPDNSSMMLENDHMENNSGWNMTNMTLQENNISVNYSVDATYGTMLTGINGFDAPADYSWWWSLYLWNETSESWDESQVGIDSIVMGQDAEHIAWAPSSADVSMLPVPEEHHDEEDESGLMEEMMMQMLRMVFNESDMDGDGLLNESELEHFLGGMDEDDGHPAGYVTIHVMAEGDYGFALPMDVEFHILDNDGGHDDHAGHDDHDDHGDDAHGDDDHDDHADEEGEDHADEEGDDHDDHADEEGDDHDDHGDEGALDYDPHSWLSPLAFKAQVTVVMDALTTAFPAGEEVFKTNAELYAAQLTALDVAFDAAFGEGGMCMAGGYEKTVAANHNAYSYIGVEYGIQFMTVHGLDPEGEPSPEDVAKVVDFIKEEGITVLFVEEYTDQSSVQSIVDETGVSIEILYTMEMAPSDADDTYMTMMSKNLENLIDGIGCV